MDFSVRAPLATAVTLCLEGQDGVTSQQAMTRGRDARWHTHVDHIGHGQCYGFRVEGPWDPPRGVRTNPAKLLLDPYGSAVHGTMSWGREVLDHDGRDESRSVRSRLDSAPHVPRSVVIDPTFDWGDDTSPNVPWADTVVYEVHLAGLTKSHPEVPASLRGTYAGAAHPAVIDHLIRLGVTAVEFLPIHAFVDDARLAGDGLTNYWGYNSIGFFAPHAGYAASGAPGAAVVEFKTLVARLHAAGIEVLLDVVYNHTGEGSLDGPTLHLRGFDNAASYRHHPDQPGSYADTTGTGNTIDAQRSPMAEMILASLRHWVIDYHVDGFRFDLATALGRTSDGVEIQRGVLAAIAQDSVLADVKLIAEPWDLGEDGYQLGNFPAAFSEWNDRFRNTVRDFWRGAPCRYDDLGEAMMGSPRVFAQHGRTPSSSINFVTCHDGMTLADLVSYASKHNEANGEDNRDGTDDNRSDNLGVEGVTDDDGVLTRRRARQRALLTTLLLARGVPMLLGGDEIGRTHHGNNNAYCQDNPLSWLDWPAADMDLVDFVRTVLAVRARTPELRDQQWLHARWFDANGDPAESDVDVDRARPVAMIVNGSFAMIFHAAFASATIRLPTDADAAPWLLVFDSSAPNREDLVVAPSLPLTCQAQSVLLLKRATSD